MVIATLIGLPLGFLGSRSERMHHFLGAMCDTLQTLPSFVYLLPVVMLFPHRRRLGAGGDRALRHGAGDPLYRPWPAPRAAQPAEAGTMAGCTGAQRLAKVERPMRCRRSCWG